MNIASLWASLANVHLQNKTQDNLYDRGVYT